MVVAGIYTPTNVDVIHKIDVDVVNRDDIPEPLHLVQYDQKIQVVEVSLWNGGEAYTVPTGASVNVRYLKPDHTFVYNPALGVNNSRSVVYFQISQEMTTSAGRGSFIIEIMTSENKVLGTATAEVIIDKNPVQNDGIESKSEFKTLLNYVTEAEASKNAAKVSEDNAASSAAAASTSARNAKTSETNAENSAAAASTSARNAKTSETNAANSATASSDSADKAKISETNAKVSETAAKDSKTKAKTSETNAKASETAAKSSELKAKTSEDNAKTSETNAANSATASSNSATASAKSAQNAKTSETNAASSASIADDSARDALTSEQNAKTSETNAGVSAAEALMSKNAAATSASQAYASETNAANSAQEAQNTKTEIVTALENAGEQFESILNEINSAKNDAFEYAVSAETSHINADASATNAANSAIEAANAATTAETSAANNEHYAKLSESYAVGTGGSRENEAIDNSKYYYEQVKDISEGLKGTLKPKGTISFADLPPLSEVEDGWSYNISDKFTTTGDFKEGAGHTVPAGANIYKTADGLWDVLAGTPVSSVNGQTGDVLVTPENIGAFPGTILIPSNSDLNDYKTPGVYYLPATSTNVQNKPYNAVSVSYGLVVIRCTNTVVKQFIFRASTAEGDFQVRDFMSSWTEWFKLPVGIKGNRETRYRGGTVNITPDNIGAVPWYYDNGVDAGEDWDDFIEPGSRKVQGATMDEVHHAPVGLYAYGLLITVLAENPDVQNEHRLVQIYIPNTSDYYEYSRSTIAWRMKNGESFGLWSYVSSSWYNENTFLKLTGGTITGNLYTQNASLIAKGSGAGVYAYSPNELMKVALSTGVSETDKIRGLWDSVLGWFVFLNNANNLLLKANKKITLSAPNTNLQNTGVKSFTTGAGTNGWIIAVRISLTEETSYNNHTIKITIGGRGFVIPFDVYIMFESVANSDPDIYAFEYSGNSIGSDFLRLYKRSPRIWELAVKKSEAHGSVYVIGVNSEDTFNDRGVSITYPGTFVSTSAEVSTWIAPTLGGSIRTAETLKDFLRTRNAGLNFQNEAEYDYAATICHTGNTPNIFSDTVTDGTLIQHKYSDLWFTQIIQDYRTGKLAVRSKNNGVWQPIRKIVSMSLDFSDCDIPNVSKSFPGLCPPLPNEIGITKFLRQDGQWAVPNFLGDNKISVRYVNATNAYGKYIQMRVERIDNGSLYAQNFYTGMEGSISGNIDDWIKCGLYFGGSPSLTLLEYTFQPNRNPNTILLGYPEKSSEDLQILLYGSRVDAKSATTTSGWMPIYADSFNKMSSLKYKHDIKDISDEEAKKLLLIRIVSFKYNDEKVDLDRFGCIAEELANIIETAVSLKDGEPEGVDYSSLIPHTIKMVQIHDDELTDVKEELTKANEKITELEQKNQELEQRLAKLEALLLK